MFVSLALPRLRGDCVVPPPAIHIPFGEKLFDEFCRLVIHDIHFRLVSFCFQRFEYLRVCLINDMAVNIGYGFDHYCINSLTAIRVLVRTKTPTP